MSVARALPSIVLALAIGGGALRAEGPEPPESAPDPVDAGLRDEVIVTAEPSRRKRRK